MDTEAYVGDGPHVNSGFLDGLNIADAKTRMTAWLEPARPRRRNGDV